MRKRDRKELDCMKSRKRGKKKRKKKGTRLYEAQAVAIPGIYFRVFLKKYKLHNLIKREIHILTIITIKKHANT